MTTPSCEKTGAINSNPPNIILAIKVATVYGEAHSALDVTIQAQILPLLQNAQHELGWSYPFI